jgi:hypothetical protein
VIDLETIRQAARIKTDEQGALVVQLPLPVWEALLARIEGETPKNERIKSLLSELNIDPSKAPQEGWDEFQKFLKEQFLNFHEFNLGLSEDWPGQAQSQAQPQVHAQPQSQPQPQPDGESSRDDQP